jgi:hypothetical protein
MRKKGENSVKLRAKAGIPPDRNDDFTLWCRKSNCPIHRPCGQDFPRHTLGAGGCRHSVFRSKPTCDNSWIAVLSGRSEANEAGFQNRSLGHDNVSRSQFHSLP